MSKCRILLLTGKYRKVLLTQYPDKSEMGWPTYIVCDSPEEEPKIVGEVKGGQSQEEKI